MLATAPHAPAPQCPGLQVKGDAKRGNLRFVPLMLRRVGASHDTVHLAPDALAALLGQHGNATAAATGPPDI